MKKVFTAIVVIAMSVMAKSQIKLGVQAGVAMNNVKWEGFEDAKNLSKPTFGIIAQTNLGGLLFNPSINYAQTGFKFSETTTSTFGGVTTTETTNDVLQLNNLEIPLDLVIPLKTKSGKFLISIAPVITVGLKGEYTSNSTTTTSNGGSVNNNFSSPIEYGNQQGEIKKMEWGGKLGIGYLFKNGLQFNANYKAGLTNLNNDTERFKNNALNLSLAYYFIK